MKILLTGSTGYIGRRLLPVLVEAGHYVVCLVRDQRRFDWDDFTPEFLKSVSVIEVDLNSEKLVSSLPTDIDAAYYLVHSMSSSNPDFTSMESESAKNFVSLVNATEAKQVIYLSGIVNDADLSDHLLSRKNVEEILTKANAPLTVLRAAIIIGSGSASFEIIRDLVEKLPVMIAPKWLKTRCQPIGIRNVIEYLQGVLLKPETFNQTFDIGGTEILTYNQMLYGFAKMRGLRRLIVTVPVLTPKLSSLWLVFVTSTTYSLARSLVNSMKNEVICHDTRIREIMPTKLLSYQEALQLAFDKISQKNVVSSWKDSISLGTMDKNFLNNTFVPEHGVFTDKRQIEFERNKNEVIENIWSIGGNRGWYFGNWMWRIRGVMDKMVGGVGLRRGRRSDTDLKAGDALDFWRVLVADKPNGRLLLYAEMKLPGEAWLEFKVKEENSKKILYQTATYRPLGLWGRLYWYSVLPFHGLIFSENGEEYCREELANLINFGETYIMKLLLSTIICLLSFLSFAQKAKKYTAVATELSNQVIATPTATVPFRLAVVPFAATKYSTAASTQFGSYLTESVIGALAGHPNKIKLFERTRLDALLKEQEFILTDLMKPAAALKIGQLVPIDALLSGTYTKLKSYIDVSARLIDVASGEILMSFSGRIKMDKNLATLFKTTENIVVINTTPLQPTNANPVNVTVNNTINTGNEIKKSKEEICKERSGEFRKKLSDLSTPEKIDALVRDAIKVPFEDVCGAFHQDIMFNFIKYKIENEVYKNFIIQTLDTLSNPANDYRAFDMIRFFGGDEVIDDREWNAGLKALTRNGSYSLSTYLAYLLSRPKGNDVNNSIKRVDEFLSLVIQSKVGLPRPISFEVGFLETMEGMRYNQTLGEYVYKNYSPRLNLDDRSKVSVYHELDYLYQYETRPFNKTEIVNWMGDFFNKYEYEKAHENLYEFANHFLLTDYEDRNAKIRIEYPEGDTKILIEKCKARFAAYATATPYPSQREDRINFCVKYGVPIAGVIPSLDEAAITLRGNNLDEQLRVMKLLVQMGNRPKPIESNIITLFNRRTLEDKEKLREIQTLAIKVLGNVKSTQVTAITYLIESLMDYDDESYAAEETLVQIGKPTVPYLISKLDKTTDQDGGLQYRLITILGKIGKEASTAERAIQRILKINRNKDVVYAAEAALQAIR